MPTVEQLEVAYKTDVAARAQADAQALGQVAQALEITDTRLSRATRSWQSYAASGLDPVATAQRKVTQAEADATRQRAALNAEYAKGQVTLEGLAAGEAQIAARLTQRTQAAQAALENATKLRTANEAASKTNLDAAASSDRLRYAMRDLGLQSIDVFQGLASGQPIFRTLIQQGAQVAQVNAAAGVSMGDLARSIGGVVAAYAPLIAVGTVVAGMAALGAAAETSARQMLQLQNQLRATRDDYVAAAADVTTAARAIAASSGLSTGEARSAAATIRGAPNFTGDPAQLQALTRSAIDMAAVLGGTATEAAKRLAEALQAPGAEAQKLADQHLPGMSQALAYAIRLQADAGDKAGAFARVLKVLTDGTQGAADNLTPLQTALKGLSDRFTATGQDGKSFAERLGGFFTTAATYYIYYLTWLFDKAEAIIARMPSISSLPGVATGARAAGGQVKVVGDQVGLFQLRPGAASDVGISDAQRYDYTMNILGGVRYFRQQYDATGNIDDATRAYNAGLTGAQGGGGAAYLAGVIGQDASKLPPQVRSDILNAVGTIFADVFRGGGAEAISTRILQIAAQESGGQHYTDGIRTMTVRASAGEAFGPAVPPEIGQRQQAINEALKAWEASGVLGVQRDANAAAQSKLQLGIDAAQLTGDIATVQKLSEALADLRGKQADLITEQEKLARAAVDAAAALSAQSGFERDMAAVEQKFAEAARASGQAVDQRTLAVAKAAEQTRLATNYTDEIAATERATAAQLRINAAYDGTQLSLSHAQNYEKAYALALRDFPRDSEAAREAVGRYTDALDANAAALRAMEQQQASVSALASAFGQAFDTIGNSITQAFLQGAGAAVNWGNIVKSIVAQVIQQLGRLAVINPILNNLFGQNNGTLGSALAVLGGGASGAGGAAGEAAGSGGSVLGLLGNLGSALGLVNSASGGSLLSGLGLPSLSGLADSLGLGGLSSGLFAVLNTGSGIGASAAGTAAIEALGLNAGAGLGGASIGALLGGAGAGFGAGSLAGSLLQGALGKVGPAPMIGAGVGGAAGAAIGSIVPGIGTLIGGLIGGLLGGGGGGLIGPKAATPYSSTAVSSDSGLIGIGRTLAQKIDTSGELTTLRQQVDAVNQFLQQAGISIGGQTGLIQIGQGGSDPTKFTDLFAANITGHNAFSQYRFNTAGTTGEFHDAIAGQSFSSLQDLQNVVATYQKAQAAIAQSLQVTVPQMTALGKTTGSYAQQIAGLDATFQPAIDQVVALRSTLGASADQIAQLTQAEADLGAARQRASAAVIEAINAQSWATDQDLTTRYYAAAARVSGSPQDAVNAELLSFDVAAERQRKQLSDSIVGIWGDSIKSTTAYADQMSLLERTLGEERLVIQTAYWNQLKTQGEVQARATAQAQAQAAGAAANVVSSLSAYALRLQTGQASPLSLRDQYSLASRQFNAVAGAARAGNYSAQTQITGYADTLLSASRSVYGSGVGYADDFKRVLEALQDIAGQSSDQLTASAMAAQLQSQTDTLASNQQASIKLLQQILLQLRQGGSRPAVAA